MSLISVVKRLLQEEEAQTVAEYAIIVFVLVLASLKAIELFRGTLKNYFTDIAGVIAGPLP